MIYFCFEGRKRNILYEILRKNISEKKKIEIWNEIGKKKRNIKIYSYQEMKEFYSRKIVIS